MIRRQLLARTGARFSCSGDGLCCSDVHALGPLTQRERARISEIDPDSVIIHPRLGLPVLLPTPSHACVFFDGDAGCRVHREYGARTKPAACRQFPFGLVATPRGLRITTAHRCPCRTMGERKPLDLAEAREALTINGKLRIDQHVGDRIAVARTRRVGFDRYVEIETELLAAIGAGLFPLVREDGALPELESADWGDLGFEYRSMGDGSSTGAALAWFGEAILETEASGRHAGSSDAAEPARPWAWSFDRAAQRVVTPQTEADLFADFASDVVFGLRWTEEGSLVGILLALQSALLIASRISSALQQKGASPERAAAEAVMIAEVGLSGPLSYLRFERHAERALLETLGFSAPIRSPAAIRRSVRPS